MIHIIVSRCANILHKFGRFSSSKFYGGVALILSILIIADFFSFKFLGSADDGLYDWMIKNRFEASSISSSVVVVSIDEYSLKELAPELGRWPWPREIFAEIIVSLSEQGASAIGLDILISEPDLAHPDGDELLDYVAAESPNLVSAIVRQPQSLDRSSNLRIDQLPYAKRTSQASEKVPTLALLLPVLTGMQYNSGTINLNPDSDGLVRSWNLYEDIGGWTLPSLPQQLAVTAGHTNVMPKSFRINWPYDLSQIDTISFYDLITAIKRGDQKILKKFNNRVVIIGTNASGLGDVQPTSFDVSTPGVYIHAAALNNIINENYIYELPEYVGLMIALVAIWLMFLLLVNSVAGEKVEILIIVIQTIFLVFSFLLFSFYNIFIDIATIISLALVYVAIAKIFSELCVKSLNGSLWPICSSFEKYQDGYLGFIFIGCNATDINNYEKLDRSIIKSVINRGDDYFIQPNPLDVGGILESGWKYSCLIFIAATNEENCLKKVNTMVDDIKIILEGNSISLSDVEIILHGDQRIPQRGTDSSKLQTKKITSYLVQEVRL